MIKSKDEALEILKIYKAEVENRLGRKIKAIRSDRGGEYESDAFAEFCAIHGIIRQTTAPFAPQQNGVAERKNRTLKNMMNSMLNNSGLPHNLWGEALLTANHIFNRIPYKKTNKSPYQIWRGRLPTYKTFKVCGCLAKVLIPIPKMTKVGPKTVDCVFIGFANHSAAYRFLVIKSENPNVHINTIIESNEAEFFEGILPYKDKETISKKRGYDESQNESPKLSVKDRDMESRKSKRTKISKDFGPDFISYLTKEEPRTYSEAMRSPEAPYWKEAIDSEIQSISQNNTWELVNQLVVSGFSGGNLEPMVL